MLDFEVITEVPRFLQIETAWSTLADVIPHVTPFQLPHWQLTWWRHFGSGQLLALSWWHKDLLVGIVPCFLHRWEGRRQTTLIGSGISDYLEPLIHPEHRVEVIGGLQSYLQSSHDWDICNWQDLAADTCLSQLKGSVLEPDMNCSEVPLIGSFEEFWKNRSTDMRRNLRRYSDRARSMGAIGFQAVSSADQGLLDALVRLHAARWERRGESGMIAANSSGPFLRDVTNAFAARNTLRYFVIRFREKVAAILLAFVSRNIVYAYLSAFDPEYEVFGFGRNLLYEAFRFAYGNHYAAWNFCRGNEHYKFSWGAQTIEKRRLILTHDITPDSL
jgi:CelD/BcsL family acetyltransferase involved in cellulose biosynthesis